MSNLLNSDKIASLMLSSLLSKYTLMSLLNSQGMGRLIMETLSLGDEYTDFFECPVLPKNRDVKIRMLILHSQKNE